MTKIYPIIILPTEELATIRKHTTGEYYLSRGLVKGGYELHILSDDEIKDEDYYIDKFKGNDAIFKASMGCSKIGLSYSKIIASTDESLNHFTIPQSYLEYYISEYNKGNVIKEIELEKFTSKSCNVCIHTIPGNMSQCLNGIDPKECYEDSKFEAHIKIKNLKVVPVIPSYTQNKLNEIKNMKDVDIVIIDDIELIKEQEQPTNKYNKIFKGRSIEEEAKDYTDISTAVQIENRKLLKKEDIYSAYIAGAEQQASTMYSEDEVREIIKARSKKFSTGLTQPLNDLFLKQDLDWFESNKK